MAEVAFRPARQLSEFKGKGASASRELFSSPSLQKTFMRQNLKSLRTREQNMFEWRQEPCQFRDITDKVSLV